MNELQQLRDEITQLQTALTIKNGVIEQLKARVAELEAELAKLLAGQESLLLNLADQKRQAVEYREMWAKASERAHSQSSALYARQVPAGWKVDRRELDGAVCFTIGTPRKNGVRTNTSVFESDHDPAHLLLWHLLAASPAKASVCSRLPPAPGRR